MYRFQHDSHRLVRDLLLDAGDVIQFRLWKARHLRREDRVPARLARCRHRGKRAAVEAVVERDDFITCFAGRIVVQLAPFARELDCTFIRFGAAAGEKHAVEA